MKSLLGVLVAIILVLAVLGTLGGIYYLSAESQFSRIESSN